MKIVLVHDFLADLGGGERVLISLCKMFPGADIYTLLYDKSVMEKYLYGHRIFVSPLNKVPRRFKKYLLFLFPKFVEEWDFSSYDLVISSSNPYVKGILTRSPTKHICYMHAPMRFVWDYTHEYKRDNGFTKGIKKWVLENVITRLRIWDMLSSDRPDVLLANSFTTAQRIAKYYRRDSHIVYPPVQVDKYKATVGDDGYLYIISRLSKYKNLEYAILACEELGIPLKIAGTGPDEKYIRSFAKKHTEFLGFVSDAQAIDYMQRARAFLFLSDDDFGITPVEAMAAGKPVLAWARGGVLETVIEGKTGLFTRVLSVDGVKQMIQRFVAIEGDFHSSEIREHAQNFSEKVFHEKIKKIIKETMPS